ncbi:MAG: hypothetical protein RLZZ223_388 [Candidatus Parcubacteria bacterium]|jgi:signal transduction histidine kinase
MIYTILSLGLISTLSIAWIFIFQKRYIRLSRWLLFPLTGGIVWTLCWLIVHLIFLINKDILLNTLIYDFTLKSMLASIIAIPIGLIIASMYYPISSNHRDLKYNIAKFLSILYAIVVSIIFFIPNILNYISLKNSLLIEYTNLLLPQYQFILFILLLISIIILFTRLKYIKGKKVKILGLYFVLGYLFTIIGYILSHIIVYFQFNLSIIKYSPIMLIVWVIFIILGAIKYKIVDSNIFIPQIIIIWTIIIVAVIAFSNSSLIVFTIDILFLVLFSSLGLILIENLHYSSQIKLNFSKENRKLKKFIELKDNFLRMTTHQLRTPIIIVEEYTKNLLQNKELDLQKDSIELDYINKLLVNNYKLKYIIEDLSLAYAISSNKFTLQNTTKINIEELLHYLSDDLSKNYPNIKLIFQKQKNYNYLIVGDLYYISIAFKKLLENSYMFAKKEIIINIGYIRGQIIMKIIDDGIGISKTDLKQLFLPFTRSEKAISLYPDGSGISLYLVKNIIEKHKGIIQVHSKGENLGTEIIVLFHKN